MQKRFNLIEPFPLFGVESIFHSKEQAVKVLKYNSYYIFAAGFICLFINFVSTIGEMNIGIDNKYLLLFTGFSFGITYFIRKHKSRAATILSLLIFSSAFIFNYYKSGFGGFYLFTLLFIAASYRSLKASFYYHGSQ
jgi:hypothetical protein